MTKSLAVVCSLLFLSSCQQDPAVEPVIEGVQPGVSATPVQASTRYASPELRAIREGVSFAFPEQFGRSFTFTAELTEKDNTYYAQNLIEAPFLLKVLSVEGVVLDSPISIEPWFSQDTPQELAAGAIVEWNGYERLRQVGSPRIAGEYAPKIDLHYVNQLVILH